MIDYNTFISPNNQQSKKIIKTLNKSINGTSHEILSLEQMNFDILAKESNELFLIEQSNNVKYKSNILRLKQKQGKVICGFDVLIELLNKILYKGDNVFPDEILKVINIRNIFYIFNFDKGLNVNDYKITIRERLKLYYEHKDINKRKKYYNMKYTRPNEYSIFNIKRGQHSVIGPGNRLETSSFFYALNLFFNNRTETNKNRNNIINDLTFGNSYKAIRPMSLIFMLDKTEYENVIKYNYSKNAYVNDDDFLKENVAPLILKDNYYKFSVCFINNYRNALSALKQITNTNTDPLFTYEEDKQLMNYFTVIPITN